MIEPEVQRLIEQMSQRAEKMTSQIQSLSATGKDDRGHVIATCGLGGRLIDIEFTPMSRRLDTHELRERVLTAVKEATEAVQDKLKNEVGDLGDAASGLDGNLIKDTQKQVAEYRHLIDEQMAKIAEIRNSIVQSDGRPGRTT